MLAGNINVDDALIKTKQLSIQNPDTDVKFDNYSSIFLGPTSNIKRVSSLYNNRREVLTIGGMGALAYELILNKCEKIDCFDINILEYLFFALLNTAIQKLEYNEFISNFTTKKSGDDMHFFSKSFLSYDMFFDILEYIPEPARTYWSKVFINYDMLSLLKTNYARLNYPLNIEYLSKYSSLYTKESFYKLKDILNSKSIEINYYICSILELALEFKGKTYDAIIFDNILQYYRSLKDIQDVSDIKKIFDDDWIKLLNHGGIIELAYGFQVPADALKKMMNENHFVLNKDQVKELYGLGDETTFKMANELIDIQLKREIANGFICNYVKKYHDCELTFIDGVEQDSIDNTQNVVLTYTNK